MTLSFGFSDFFGSRGGPAELDPAAYPRSVPIEDDAALLHLEAIRLARERHQALQERIDGLCSELAVLVHEHEIATHSLFARLRECYPEVRPPLAGSGWRYFNGRYYYVSW